MRKQITVCQCNACGCTEPATGTDDSSVPVCDACAEYAVDEDGTVHCSRCDDVEIVSESCGHSGSRSYARIKPPEMPEADEEGGWGCYWQTVGDDAGVVSRHTTQAEARRACEAHDWPRPGDHTQYLCGYEVRVLRGGRWVLPDDEDE